MHRKYMDKVQKMHRKYMDKVQKCIESTWIKYKNAQKVNA